MSEEERAQKMTTAEIREALAGQSDQASVRAMRQLVKEHAEIYWGQSRGMLPTDPAQGASVAAADALLLLDEAIEAIVEGKEEKEPRQWPRGGAEQPPPGARPHY